MRAVLSLALAAALALPAAPRAAETALPEAVRRWQEDPLVVLDAADVGRDDFLWIARPVVVFADSPVDPAYREQMELLAARPADLARRDVVVITDTDPAARSPLRERLRPRGFMMVLIGKDGEVALRKPFPWHVREIGRSIDKMPMRQQEIRDAAREGSAPRL